MILLLPNPYFSFITKLNKAEKLSHISLTLRKILEESRFTVLTLLSLYKRIIQNLRTHLRLNKVHSEVRLMKYNVFDVKHF